MQFYVLLLLCALFRFREVGNTRENIVRLGFQPVSRVKQ